MKLLSLLLLLPLSASAFVGGSEVGNGGDDLPNHYDTGWFLGEKRTIQACLSGNFPVEPGKVSNAIQGAFGKWIQYIHARGVYEPGFQFPPEGEEPRSATLRFAEKLSVKARCDGKEDLVFYLGEGEPKADAIRKKYVDPVSFVFRESYDLKKGWSRGFVWLSAKGLSGNSWETPLLLETVLLHEFGHIFGVSHVPDTVMSENIVAETARRLKDIEETRKTHGEERAEEERGYVMNVIDIYRQLYACLNCDETHENIFMDERYSEFVGKPLTGPMSCEIHFADRFNWEFVITCQDSLSRAMWEITPNFDPRFVSSGSAIFRRALEANGALTKESVDALNGQISYGKLVTANGQAYNVTVERRLNGNSSPLVVNLMKDGEVEVLFDVTSVFE